MYRLAVSHSFSAAHRLLNFVGRCADLHGHTFRVELEVGSKEDRGTQIDKADMVIDFAKVKGVLGTFVYLHLDHACILNSDDPLVGLLKDCTNRVYVLDKKNPTAEILSELLYNQMTKMLSAVKILSVTVWESENAKCTFRPYAPESGVK